MAIKGFKSTHHDAANLHYKFNSALQTQVKTNQCSKHACMRTETFNLEVEPRLNSFWDPLNLLKVTPNILRGDSGNSYKCLWSLIWRRDAQSGWVHEAAARSETEALQCLLKCPTDTKQSEWFTVLLSSSCHSQEFRACMNPASLQYFIHTHTHRRKHFGWKSLEAWCLCALYVLV